MKKSSVRDFLTAHGIALALALVVGVISGLPQILATQALGDEYQGIPFLYQDNDVTYLTRVHELVDGHTELASPFLHEYKDGGQSVMPAVGEWLYVPFLEAISITKFLFPALIFLLLYGFAFLVLSGEQKKLGALAAASLGTIGYALIFPSEVLWLIKGADEPYLSIWTRLVHPISGGLLLLGFLISTLQTVRGKLWWALPGALFLGFSTGYIFAFGIGTVVSGIVFVLACFERRWKEVGALIGMGIGALIINLPHFVSVLSRGVGAGSGDAQKAGLLLTHEPLVSTSLLLAVLVVGALLFYLWRKGATLTVQSGLVFSFVTVCACVMAMNQQLITGRTAWPQHFIQYAVPLIYIALIASLTSLTRIPQWVQKVLLVGAIVASFALGFVSLPSYKTVLEDYRTVNRYAGALTFLRAHEGPCVAQPVEVSERMNSFITAFTHCDVYLTHYVFMGVPEDRIMHNFLVYMRLTGVTPETVKAFLQENRKKVWAVFFRDWRDIFHDTRDPWLLKQSDYVETEVWLDSLSEKIASEYTASYDAGARELLTKYRLDYVVWDREGGTPFSPQAYPFLKPVFEADSVVVYRVE